MSLTGLFGATFGSECIAAKCQLFDHLVGNCEQLVWYREAEGLGRLEIDSEQEFSRLFHWEIGRLCAF